MRKPITVHSTALALATLAIAGLAGALPLRSSAATAPAAGTSQDSPPIEAVWHPQEIRYSYSGFTTAYSCDAAEAKLKGILLALGAHPQTKVKANGCILDRPSRDFFVTITTATPVAAADAPAPALSQSQQELLQRLGVKNQISSAEFPAAWKTVRLSRDRDLDLQPGDCELMEGLRNQVLPKLAVRIVNDKVQCMPKQLSITTPELTVSALVALPSPDAANTLR